MKEQPEYAYAIISTEQTARAHHTDAVREYARHVGFMIFCCHRWIFRTSMSIPPADRTFARPVACHFATGTFLRHVPEEASRRRGVPRKT